MRAYQRSGLGTGLTALGFVLALANPAAAALGDCAQPISNGSKPNTSDALAILKAAVGGNQCDAKPCICDPNGDGDVKTVDALYALKVAVGQNLVLSCICAGTAPVADAGLDDDAIVGQPELLDGSGSSDGEGDELTYEWTLIGMPEGSAAVLDDPLSANPSFLPDIVGVYIVRLVVSDGEQDSDPDVVVITATSPILVTATPTAIITESQTNVRVLAQISDPDVLANSVQLFQVNASFETVGNAFCALLDNGSLANGDDIAGDQVYSCILGLIGENPGIVHLAVQATIDAAVVRSGVALTVVAPLSQQDAETIVAVQDAALLEWQEQKALLGDTLEAREATVAAILAMEGVADAGVSEDGVTIWIDYESGALGGLMLNPEGTRGAPVQRFSWQAPPLADFVNESPPTFDRPPGPPYADGQGGGAGEDVGTVDSTNVLIWDAYNFQFAPFDEGPGLQTLFMNSPCPKFTVTYIKDSACDVASVANFASFGTVIMVTHGAVDGGGRVVFLTTEAASVLGILSHPIDMALGRIMDMGGVFAIRPSYISNLSGTFDNSIIYNGSCQSSANATMANAFTGKGASNYYGFTRVVNSDFAQSVATQLFTNLVTGAMDTTESFTPVTPKVDPKAPNATFTHTSTEKVEYTGQLINGDFERGDLTGWNVVGDGRAVGGLGPIAPSQGNVAGLVSTGLGFTTASGSIQQNFCLPATATSLSFDWNFNSEEFTEWCFRGFDDRLTVTLQTEAGPSQVLFERIDTLCSSVGPTSLFFDQSGPGCEVSLEGDGFDNDCTVWGTGWQHRNFDVAAIAAANSGKGVTLSFSVGDVGDSIFDSAVLLDDIKVEP